MAPSFGRSISFTLSPSRSTKTDCHVRSVSLPCRSHPLLSSLQAQIVAVRSWTQDPTPAPSSGFIHLEALHMALSELLLLPEARSALQNVSATGSSLLDGFLVQEIALELKAAASEAQAALRRHDSARLASAVRAQRRSEKQLARLSATVSGAATGRMDVGVCGGVLSEAVAVVASASAALFAAVESMSAAATALATAFSSKKTSLISFVKRSGKTTDEEKEILALERLEEVEGCIAEIESGSDKVFRSILQTRVALHNIHTQTC